MNSTSFAILIWCTDNFYSKVNSSSLLTISLVVIGKQRKQNQIPFLKAKQNRTFKKLCVTPPAHFLVCLFNLSKIQCLNLSATWRQETRKLGAHGTVWEGNTLLSPFLLSSSLVLSCPDKMGWWVMVIMAWLAPETRDLFKEIFKLLLRGSWVLGGDSRQMTIREDLITLQRIDKMIPNTRS